MKKQINKPLPKNTKKPSTFKNRAKSILLGLFLFWTICSFISIACLIMLIDSKSKDNSAMITASAAEGDLIYAADLNGLRGMYFTDGSTYILKDTASVEFIYNTIGNIDSIVFYLGDYLTTVTNSYRDIEGDFIESVSNDSYGYNLFIRYNYNMLSSLTSNHYLESVSYNTLVNNIRLTFVFRDRISFGSVAVELEISLNGSIPLKLPNYYTQNLAENQLIIDSLQNRITQLEQQIAVNASIIAQKDSRIDSLLAENNDLALEIADLNALLEDIQSSYSQAYDNGYSEGYREGGLATGNDSYNKGYADAMEDAGNNSFRGLIGALIDVPVKAMSSLLDWNLLGVNLKEFFFSILSVIVVICIAKLFMGG